MSEAKIPQFVQAVMDEWSKWKKWSSCRPVYVDINKIDPSLILKSRVCFCWKPRGDGSFKPKARILIAGYRDPHLPLLSRDSPVLSRAGLHCILQWEAVDTPRHPQSTDHVDRNLTSSPFNCSVASPSVFSNEGLPDWS